MYSQYRRDSKNKSLPEYPSKIRRSTFNFTKTLMISLGWPLRKNQRGHYINSYTFEILCLSQYTRLIVIGRNSLKNRLADCRARRVCIRSKQLVERLVSVSGGTTLSSTGHHPLGTAKTIVTCPEAQRLYTRIYTPAPCAFESSLTRLRNDFRKAS